MRRLLMSGFLLMYGGFATAYDVTPKIVGGDNATSGHWPWMTLVGPSEAGAVMPTWRCGGVLISPHFVITAAHCMFNERFEQFDTVMLAANTVTVPTQPTGYVAISRTAHNPPHIEVNPGYDRTNGPNRNNYNHDIVLIHIEDGIDVARYPDLASADDLIRLEQSRHAVRNDVLTALGWGELVNLGPLATRLQQVTLDYIPRATCRNAWQNILGPSMVCAAEPNPPASAPNGQDTCRGDSGGPLFTGDRNSPNIVGLTSFGAASGCGGSNPPGVYTSVADYTLWLERRTYAFNHPITDILVSTPASLRSGLGTTRELFLAVKNNSLFNDVSGIRFSVNVPAALSIDNVSGAICDLSNAVLSCSIDSSLAQGEELAITMDLTHLVAEEVSEKLTFEVEQDQFDYRSANNSSAVNITFTDRRPSSSSGGAALYLLPLLLGLRWRKLSVSQVINSSASAIGAR